MNWGERGVNIRRRTGHRRLLFWLLKFPQNHTIFEEKTNHKGEEGAERKKKYRFMCSHSILSLSWSKILQVF
jgi:hypothetical protein